MVEVSICTEHFSEWKNWYEHNLAHLCINDKGWLYSLGNAETNLFKKYHKWTLKREESL